MKLIVATKNRGKLVEFAQLLGGLPFEVSSLADYPDFPDIDETGTTFAENAAIKAEAVALATGQLALADDSGLEVDALGGRPGVYSARYAGAVSSDDANNRKLLEELAGIPAGERTARFRSVIAIAGPDRQTQWAEGTIEGVIGQAPSGEGGFGYDPLFFVPERGKTFAQMTTAEKNSISHRARAMQNALLILKQIAAGRD
jgi:XTP/dITP diphosphohydrolase